MPLKHALASMGRSPYREVQSKTTRVLFFSHMIGVFDKMLEEDTEHVCNGEE